MLIQHFATFGQVPKRNGMYLIVLSAVMLIVFVYGFPKYRAGKIKGGPAGRVLVSGPAGIVLLIFGIYLLFAGY